MVRRWNKGDTYMSSLYWPYSAKTRAILPLHNILQKLIIDKLSVGLKGEDLYTHLQAAALAGCWPDMLT